MTNWKATIDVSLPFQAVQNDDAPVKDVITAFIAGYKRVPEALKDDDSELVVENFECLLEAANKLAQDVDADEFDSQLQDIYEWADAYKVWIKTI